VIRVELGELATHILVVTVALVLDSFSHVHGVDESKASTQIESCHQPGRDSVLHICGTGQSTLCHVSESRPK
jgi:hypothetical protein